MELPGHEDIDGGKRAGALVKLRQLGLHTGLPVIDLANVCSLAKKTDELLLFNSKTFTFLLTCI